MFVFRIHSKWALKNLNICEINRISHAVYIESKTIVWIDYFVTSKSSTRNRMDGTDKVLKLISDSTGQFGFQERWCVSHWIIIVLGNYIII